MPGTTYNAPAVDLYTITQQPEGTVPETGGTADVYCTSAYPGGLVAKALSGGSFTSDAQWYTLSVRGSQAVVATADGIRTQGQGQTRQLAKGNMWTFVKEDGNPDGFKVYNLLKGAASPLYVSSNASKTDASFATGSEETGTTTFTITANGSGFNLQYPGNANANLGDHHSGALSVWNNGGSAGDGGSRFVVAEVNDLLDVATVQEYPGYVGSLLPYDIQESPAYIFGVDDDDSSQLGANKVYFAPQGDSAASRYILRFGNEGTTGIQGVGTADEAESETYYDLSGRRVLYPAKGIYVTGSGKKVFLK